MQGRRLRYTGLPQPAVGGKSVRLSLVIPCYNEAKNLELLVPRCVAVTKATGCEVILVDNGSKDDSPAVLSRLLADLDGIRSVRVEVNQGYGFGILSGLRAAVGDVLAWTHADIQTDPLDVIKGFAMFQEAQDPARLFVKGRRYGRPASDVVFTMGMSAFESMLMLCPLDDINAQPTMFHREFFETWSDPPSDFSLDLYAFVLARKSKLMVSRFPVKFGERAFGQSSWNVNWGAKQKFIQRTLDYSFRLRSSLSRSRK